MKGHMENGKFHPHTDYKKGTRKSRDQTKKTKGVRMKRYARPSQLGVGARVVLEKPVKNMMGDVIPDFKVGMVGTVIDHSGGRKEPIIKFDEIAKGYNIHVDPEDLKVTRPSKMFDFEFVKAVGSSEQLKDRLMSMGYNYSDGGDNWVYGYEYLDNGEGRSGDVPYSIELFNNRAKVHVLKGDIPNYWRWMADEITESIREKVEGDLQE